jgi:hypothetical protein
MQPSSVAPPRKLYPELQILCNALKDTKGGFLGMVLNIIPRDVDLPLSTKAIQANKGRTLYPELQYLCNLLNSGKRFF